MIQELGLEEYACVGTWPVLTEVSQKGLEKGGNYQAWFSIKAIKRTALQIDPGTFTSSPGPLSFKLLPNRVDYTGCGFDRYSVPAISCIYTICSKTRGRETDRALTCC